MDLTITLYSYEIRYNAHKHIETTERGLVIVASHESDSGRYDCHLGGSLLCSYIITVDAHRYEYDAIMLYHNIYSHVFLIMILTHGLYINLSYIYPYRCTAPSKSNDYQKIYADWCHEFEKYKSAMKLWEKRQSVSLK